MKRLLPAVLILCSLHALGQRIIEPDSNPSFSERVYLGGGLGASGGTDSYGNKYFYIGVYPILGYMVTDKFSVGTSLSYQYYDYTDIGQSYSQYGFSPFARYNIGQLFAYTEFMFLNSPTFINSERATYNRWLMGLGYSQPLGGRAAINVMGLYDVIYKQSDRVFSSPWVFRVFVSF